MATKKQQMDMIKTIVSLKDVGFEQIDESKLTKEQSFVLFAEIKDSIKRLDELRKKIEKDCIDKYGEKKLEVVEFGEQWSFSKTEKENKSVVNNKMVFAKIGQNNFIENATISPSKIKKIGGEILLSELEQNGAIEKGEPSVYYLCKRKKLVE